MMHNYEESEAELKAIFEAEKWETCYKELETHLKEKNEDVIFLNGKSCHKLPDIIIPKGYYLFDLYEPIENIANEYKKEEARLKEEYEEMVFDFESSDGFLIEELGDYDLMKYYCDSEEQGPTEPHNNYSGGCEWYKGKLYINTNELGGYNSDDYYASQEDYNEPCLSEDELEVERVDLEDYQEDYKEEHPWEFYSLEVFWEEVRKVEEPWEYYPEVLETLWNEDYGEVCRNGNKNGKYSM